MAQRTERSIHLGGCEVRIIKLIVRFILVCAAAVIGGWAMGFTIIKIAGLIGLA